MTQLLSVCVPWNRLARSWLGSFGPHFCALVLRFLLTGFGRYLNSPHLLHVTANSLAKRFWFNSIIATNNSSLSTILPLGALSMAFAMLVLNLQSPQTVVIILIYPSRSLVTKFRVNFMGSNSFAVDSSSFVCSLLSISLVHLIAFSLLRGKRPFWRHCAFLHFFI